MKTFRPKNHTEKHQHRANCDVHNRIKLTIIYANESHENERDKQQTLNA